MQEWGCIWIIKSSSKYSKRRAYFEEGKVSLTLQAHIKMYCWSQALIWSLDHARANYHLLTYTSWLVFCLSIFQSKSTAFIFIFVEEGCKAASPPGEGHYVWLEEVRDAYFTHCVDSLVGAEHCNPTWQIQVDLDCSSPSLNLQHLWLFLDNLFLFCHHLYCSSCSVLHCTIRAFFQ